MMEKLRRKNAVLVQHNQINRILAAWAKKTLGGKATARLDFDYGSMNVVLDGMPMDELVPPIKKLYKELLGVDESEQHIRAYGEILCEELTKKLIKKLLKDEGLNFTPKKFLLYPGNFPHLLVVN